MLLPAETLQLAILPNHLFSQPCSASDPLHHADPCQLHKFTLNVQFGLWIWMYEEITLYLCIASE